MQSTFNKDKACLVNILESASKIQDFIININSADEFFENSLVFDAVLMNFVVIGESVTKLSDGFKNTYNNIEWQKIKGFRNIIAHDYFGIDAEEIWQICSGDLLQLVVDIKKLNT
ncbi:MAG: DUF86 domain-containing protein [Candidatus Kapaibacteriales bacterium]